MQEKDTEQEQENLNGVEVPVERPPEADSNSSDATNNKLQIVLFVLAIVVIGGAAIVALGRTKTVEAPEASNTAPITRQTDKAKFPVGGALDDKLSFEPFDISRSSVDKFHEPTGRFLAIPTDKDLSYAASITQKDPESPMSVDAVRTYFYADLRDAGYEDYIDPNEIISGFDNLEKTIALKKGDVICKLNVSGLDNVAVSVGQYCADMSQASVVAENMEPFYEAYEAGDEYQASGFSGPYIITLSGYEKQNSEIAGYQYQYGGIGYFDVGGANVAYARVDGGEWVFFAGRQAMLACSKYTSELFQKALAHETCYNPSNDTQVLVKEFFNLQVVN